MSSAPTDSASAGVSSSAAPTSSITSVATSSRTASTSSSSPTSSFNPFNTPQVANPGGGGGTSGSLYIYTFLITIIVLASISGALLFRAYYIRRRFQRRIEEAIQNGQPLPQDAAAALGLLRPRQKKEKKLPPMPGMWEAEMVLGEKADEEASVGMGGEGASWEKADSSRWEGITPVSVLHFPPALPPDPRDDENAIFDIPPDLFARAPQRFTFLPDWLPQPRLPRPPHLARTETRPLVRREPAYVVPDRGAPVSVGVVIAMPFEGHADEYWVRDEDEEREVPDVYLGVLDARMD